MTSSFLVASLVASMVTSHAARERQRAEYWAKLPVEVKAWLRNPTFPPPAEVQAWETQEQKQQAATPGYVAPGHEIRFNLKWEAALLNDIKQCREFLQLLRETKTDAHLIPAVEGVLERTEKQLKDVREKRANMYGPPVTKPALTDPAKK